jgi:pimeloyl-ACP methyl ester carboxylesterase
MKRLIGCSLVLLLVAQPVVMAESPTPAPPTIIWMSGIYDHTDYEGDHNTIPIAAQVQGVYGKYGNTENQVVIAHSQGGVRALAYAKMLREKGQIRTLRGLIAIDAPVNGHRALADRSVTYKKAIDLVKKLGEPITASLATAAAAFNVKDVIAGFILDAGIDSGISSTAAFFGIQILNAMGGHEVSGLLSLFTDPAHSTFQGINDLDPHGAIIQALNPEERNIPPAYQVRVQTGTTSGWYVSGWTHVWFVPVPVISWGTWPVYTYKTVQPRGTLYQLGGEPGGAYRLPMGMIIGSDAGLKHFAYDYLKDHGGGEGAVKLTSDIYGVTASTIMVGSTVLALTCLATDFWYLSPSLMYLAVVSGIGLATMINIDKEWGDVLGSRNNDGLIPVPDQSRNIELLNGDFITGEKKTSVWDVKTWPGGGGKSDNHASCTRDARIYGARSDGKDFGTGDLKVLRDTGCMIGRMTINLGLSP